jgi:outer membrane protein assembly factor BamB
VSSSPAIDQTGVIYVCSEDGYLYAINPNGTRKWRYLTGSAAISSPAIGSDGTIYVGSSDNKLYAINPADGSKKWEFSIGGGVASVFGIFAARKRGERVTPRGPYRRKP